MSIPGFNPARARRLGWFELLVGQGECAHDRRADAASAGYEIDGTTLRTAAAPGEPPGPGRAVGIGAFATPSLGELRARAAPPPADVAGAGTALSFGNVFGSVSLLHSLPENCHATFQVASQFNCLEMPCQRTTPFDGVTGEACDDAFAARVAARVAAPVAAPFVAMLLALTTSPRQAMSSTARRARHAR